MYVCGKQITFSDRSSPHIRSLSSVLKKWCPIFRRSILDSFDQTPFELYAIKAASLHGPLHVLLEHPPVGLQLVRGLLVQRVLRVGLEEEVLQAVDDRVDCQHGLPVLAEDVQAHVAICKESYFVEKHDLGVCLH